MFQTAQDGTGSPPPFARTSETAIRDVLEALLGLFGSLGLANARPVELERGLELEKTLSWRVSRFVSAPDPLLAFKYLPGESGIGTILAAARRAGADEGLLEAVREACARLSEHIAEHGGDRATFVTMVENHAEEGARTTPEMRRQLYRASSQITGVSARLQTLTVVVMPSATPGMMDCMNIAGLVDLVRFRPDRPWIFRRRRIDDTAAETSPSRLRIEPLSDTDPRAEVPVIERFCSDPTPELRRFATDDGWAYDEVLPGVVGKRGRVTFFAGDIMRDAVKLKPEEPGKAQYTLTVRTPCEAVLFDLLIHRDLTEFRPPDVCIDGLLEARPVPRPGGDDTLRLDPDEPARSIGSPPGLRTPLLPNYHELVAWSLEKSGHEQAEFRGFRGIIDYPAVPCDITMRCELTVRPSPRGLRAPG